MNYLLHVSIEFTSAQFRLSSLKFLILPSGRRHRLLYLDYSFIDCVSPLCTKAFLHQYLINLWFSYALLLCDLFFYGKLNLRHVHDEANATKRGTLYVLFLLSDYFN